MSELNDELERFARDGDFDAQWEAAVRTSNPRIPVYALALAAVAVLALVAWSAAGPWLAPPPEEAAASAMAPPPGDDLLTLGVGAALVVNPTGELGAVSVVDPSLLTVANAAPTVSLTQAPAVTGPS